MSYQNVGPRIVVTTAYQPLSHKALPQPRFPSQECYAEVAGLQRRLVQNSGFRPDVYSKIDGGLYRCIRSVYDNLTEHLIQRLSDLDAVDLSYSLYRRYEEILGNILKLQHEAVPEIQFDEGAGFVRQTNRLLERLTSLTEAIRWLIEIAVKHCESPGLQPEETEVDYLITLGQSIWIWDATWEYVGHSVLPHSVTIQDDYTVSAPQPTVGLVAPVDAYNAYKKDVAPYSENSAREWAASVQVPSREVEVGEAGEIPGLEELSQALEVERGYTLEEWFSFAGALMDSFGPSEYCKCTKLSDLAEFMSSKWGVGRRQMESLLIDHGLSRHTVADLDMGDMLPVEHGRRDSRLLRRPIVVLERLDERICIYGIELLELYAALADTQLVSGRFGIPMTEGGPLAKAIGAIQKTLGNLFRDQVKESCTAAGFLADKEKETVGSENLRQISGIGPVDVFIVDSKHRRFILAEAKDTADESLVPSKMGGDFRKFLVPVDKLKKQVAWFEARVNDLKAEYGIPADVAYTIEGTIVVRKPRLWMYNLAEPLPIVDERRFYALLESGGRFQTAPIPN